MESQRELRYYASIPRIVVFVLLAGSFFSCGWWAWTTRHSFESALVGALGLGFGGISLLVLLAWLVTAVFVRRPLLTINGRGFCASAPIVTRRRIRVPWTDVWGIGIQAQKPSGNRLVPTIYYLAVYERDEGYDGDEEDTDAAAVELETASGYVRVNLNYVYTPIVSSLTMLFLPVTRKRRAQLLERIKATFAPEIVQYNIWVDEEERPL